MDPKDNQRDDMDAMQAEHELAILAKDDAVPMDEKQNNMVAIKTLEQAKKECKELVHKLRSRKGGKAEVPQPRFASAPPPRNTRGRSRTPPKPEPPCGRR